MRIHITFIAVVAASMLAAARRPASAQSESELAKASQNPIANLTSLPVQFNYYMGGGLASRTSLIVNVQPVLPLKLNDRWLLISRTVVPYVNLPMIDGTRRTGIADIQQQFYFTQKKSSMFVWGAGPIFSVPTATNDVARTGQWSLGPTAVGLISKGRWLGGLLANNLWRIGGVNHGPSVNQLTTQPFLNFNIPSGWAISSSPLITANWSATSSQRWTVPIGLGLSKVTAVGRQAVSISAQYYHAVEHPDNAGANQFRFQATMLYPIAHP